MFAARGISKLSAAAVLEYKKLFLLVVGILFVGLVAYTMSINVIFDGRIMPGVSVAGHDLGGMTEARAEREISMIAANFELRMQLSNKYYTASSGQLGITFDAQETAVSAYQAGRVSWIPNFKPIRVAMSYQINGTQLNTFVTGIANQVGTPPVDASISTTGGNVAIVPDHSGLSINKLGLEMLIQQDAANPSSDELHPTIGVESADIQAQSLGTTVSLAKSLIATPISLQFGSKTYAPTAAQIGSWIAFTKEPDGLVWKLVPEVNTSQVSSYVSSVARHMDTSPITEQDVTINGVTTVLDPGQNGETVNQGAIVTAISHAITTEQALNYNVTAQTVSYSTHNTNLVPLNYPQYVEVDLTTQHLWAWQNGQVIYDSPVTSGATGAGFPTVTGLFHIYYKATDVHLIGYEYGPAYNYDVFVQYWMPFYSGYGLHDASWRNGNFGGQDYYYGGSHGCVNLPLATAQFLYGWTIVGTPVYIHN